MSFFLIREGVAQLNLDISTNLKLYANVYCKQSSVYQNIRKDWRLLVLRVLFKVSKKVFSKT